MRLNNPVQYVLLQVRYFQIWELLLAIVGVNFTQHNEFAAVLSQWAIIMAHVYFSISLYQMQCLPHLTHLLICL